LANGNIPDGEELQKVHGHGKVGWIDTWVDLLEGLTTWVNILLGIQAMKQPVRLHGFWARKTPPVP